MKFLNHLSLQGSELRDAIVQVLGAGPPTTFPGIGRVWTDSRTTRNDGGAITYSAQPHLRFGVSVGITEANYKTVAFLDDVDFARTLANGSFFVGNASNVATATLKSAIPWSGFGAATADTSMGNGTANWKITNLAAPAADTDAANKKYVDDADALKLNKALTDGWFFVGNGSGIAVGVAKNTIPLSGFASPTQAVQMGSQQLSGLPQPLNGTDAANKDYVDARAGGMLTKAAVNYATAAALPANTITAPSAIGGSMTATANGILTVDGTSGALAIGTRILVKDEAGASPHRMNGIYVVTQPGAAGAPWVLTRATDADGEADDASAVKQGVTTSVLSGATNAGKTFALFTPNPIVLNTTPLLWQVTYQAQDLIAGLGLVKNSTTVDVEVSENLLDFDAGGTTGKLRVKHNTVTGGAIIAQATAGSTPVWLASDVEGYVPRISLGSPNFVEWGNVKWSEVSGRGIFASLAARSVIGNPTNALAAPVAVTGNGASTFLKDTGTALAFSVIAPTDIYYAVNGPGVPITNSASAGFGTQLNSTTDGTYLMRRAGALGFNAIAVADLPSPYNTVTSTSVLGNSAATNGLPVAIQATLDKQFLSRQGTTLGFALMALADLPTLAATSVQGRSANTLGVQAAISALADNQLLMRRSGALSFTTLLLSDLPTGTARVVIGNVTGDNVTKDFPINHGLGTSDVQVQVFDAAAPFDLVRPDIERHNNVAVTTLSTTHVTIRFATAPANSVVYRVVVMG